MNHKSITGQIRKLGISPEPEGKKEFFRCLGEKGLLNRRPAVISHKEFLAIQLFYIKKWVWVLSGILLLFIAWVCSRNAGNYPFALTPLLAAGILYETGRSGRYSMTELEQAARFSARSVLLARAFLLGAINTAGLVIIILVVRHFYSYPVIRVFLYMMVPYLTAALLGSVFERRHRADQGWGSVLICILSSVVFASAPLVFRQLYEERLIVLWAAVFILMICGLTVCIWKSISGREEPVWS
ncbi:MAG: hypothetical protein IKF16_07785 [Lachnospiraceae bacterium]|nr:hypothetical protein [Lachnospiraceae bacterium]